MRAWLGRALISLTLAVSCAKATDEDLLAGDDDDSGGTSGSGGFSGTGFGGTSGTGASPFGGAAGLGGTSGGKGGTASGGANATGGKGGTGGASDGGASDGGEGGTDACTPPTNPPDLRVDYKEGGRAITEEPGGEIRLQNQTTETIPLSELSFRYWFTSEFTCDQTTDQWTVTIDDFRLQNPHVEKMKPDVTIRVAALDTVPSGCDAYFELGFRAAAGSIKPDQYAAISYHSQIPIYNEGPHSQANDYSYGACTMTHVYWDKITVYRNGRLVAGTPPGGGGEGGAGGEGGGGMGGI